MSILRDRGGLRNTGTEDVMLARHTCVSSNASLPTLFSSSSMVSSIMFLIALVASFTSLCVIPTVSDVPFLFSRCSICVTIVRPAVTASISRFSAMSYRSVNKSTDHSVGASKRSFLSPIRARRRRPDGLRTALGRCGYSRKVEKPGPHLEARRETSSCLSCLVRARLEESDTEWRAFVARGSSRAGTMLRD